MSIPTSLTSHILLYFFIFYFLTLLSFSSPTNHFHNSHLSYSTFLFLFISPISFLSHSCHPLPIPTTSRITSIGTLYTACLQHHLHPITILGHFSTTSRFTTTSFSTLEFLKKKNQGNFSLDFYSVCLCYQVLFIGLFILVCGFVIIEFDLISFVRGLRCFWHF